VPANGIGEINFGRFFDFASLARRPFFPASLKLEEMLKNFNKKISSFNPEKPIRK